ncbi:hypothetical protein [Corynebacterium doosanense]|uniref:DUF559 domain-containing protein n=1 Tax=Corynebacterium doosanense CAU 212 = DSM 45436 TaxID=558173 RepID=A0A097ICQ7_9CORY|nr:hypothetical protein [Corynebacterium doosanense]AIT59904.1 hypothetical protein CDOO_00115 [Corynebacterium doosanense CAU 212 = DSM 45436]
MSKWTKRYGLVEIRKLPLSDVEQLTKIRNGTYLKLTDEVAVDRVAFGKLKRWDQLAARAAAAGLTADKAVVSGVAAARLWGLGVRGYDPTVDLTTMKAKAQSPKHWPPNVRYRSTHLNPGDFIEDNGLRLTTLGRTVADITRWHGFVDGVIAIDSARHRYQNVSFAVLRESALGLGPFHGRALVRRVLDLSRPDIDSPLESWARALLIEAGVGVEILTQVEIRGTDGSRYYRVDLLIDGWLIIEIDGAVKYDGETFGETTAEVLRAEREREKYLQNEGYVFLRVGMADLLPDSNGEFGVVVKARALLDHHAARVIA